MPSVKMAVISDIHSNLPALEAVLEEVKGMRIFCLGDLVGYNPFPSEVIELLVKRDIPSIMGNHDNAVLTGDTSWLNPVAASAIEWTIDALTEENMEYLKGLPIFHEDEFYAVHGSPREPLEEYVYPDYPADVLESFFVYTKRRAIGLGHTHVPFKTSFGEKLIFNPGSVGQPRDLDPRAAYAIFDSDNNEVEINRVSYDIEIVSNAIKKAGLPKILAERLPLGW